MDVLLQELGDDFVLGYELGFELLELAILKRRAGTFRRSLEGSCAIFKELFLPQIKLGGLDAMPFAEFGDRYPIDQVLFDDGHFLLRGEVPTLP